MIFNVPGHIDLIRNGLHYEKYQPYYHPSLIIKTQTRRLNRGIYQVGKDYAVQRKRGVAAEPDIRIVMDRIWEEKCTLPGMVTGGYFRNKAITKEDAWAEGGYTPEQYERVFRELNPKWDGKERWIFVFHVIEVQT